MGIGNLPSYGQPKPECWPKFSSGGRSCRTAEKFSLPYLLEASAPICHRYDSKSLFTFQIYLDRFISPVECPRIRNKIIKYLDDPRAVDCGFNSPSWRGESQDISAMSAQ